MTLVITHILQICSGGHSNSKSSPMSPTQHNTTAGERHLGAWLPSMSCKPEVPTPLLELVWGWASVFLPYIEQ
jgi:hypothetical protein